jgi:hypothetical protein
MFVTWAMNAKFSLKLSGVHSMRFKDSRGSMLRPQWWLTKLPRCSRTTIAAYATTRSSSQIHPKPIRGVESLWHSHS